MDNKEKQQIIYKEVNNKGYSIRGKIIFFKEPDRIIGYEISSLQISIRFLKKRILEKYCNIKPASHIYPTKFL